MLACPHCQAPIKLHKLKADYSYDRERIPWYRFVEAKYACPQCEGALVVVNKRQYPWLLLGLVVVAMLLLRKIAPDYLTQLFSLSKAAHDLLERDLAPPLFIIGTQLACILVIRSRTTTTLLPATATENTTDAPAR